MSKLLTHFSSWEKLKSSTAWYLRLCKLLLNMVKTCRNKMNIDKNQSRCDTGRLRKHGTKMKANLHLTMKDLNEAEMSLIKYVQQQEFSKENGDLQESSKQKDQLKIKKSSSICKLDPLIFGLEYYVLKDALVNPPCQRILNIL